MLYRQLVANQQWWVSWRGWWDPAEAAVTCFPGRQETTCHPDRRNYLPKNIFHWGSFRGMTWGSVTQKVHIYWSLIYFDLCSTRSAIHLFTAHKMDDIISKWVSGWSLIMYLRTCKWRPSRIIDPISWPIVQSWYLMHRQLKPSPLHSVALVFSERRHGGTWSQYHVEEHFQERWHNKGCCHGRNHRLWSHSPQVPY